MARAAKLWELGLGVLLAAFGISVSQGYWFLHDHWLVWVLCGLGVLFFILGLAKLFRPSPRAEHGAIRQQGGNYSANAAVSQANTVTIHNEVHHHEAAPIAVPRKPRARVFRGEQGFFLSNEGPALYEVYLRSAPVGQTTIKWDSIPVLPEAATLPLSYSLWILGGNVRADIDIRLLPTDGAQVVVPVAIVCRDAERGWWDGKGVLVYDKGSKQWASNGFLDMQQVQLGGGGLAGAHLY